MQVGKFSLIKLSSNDETFMRINCTDIDTIVHMADIFYDTSSKDCFIKTHSSNVQDYIICWDDYCDFIRLVDEAYDTLFDEAYNKLKTNKGAL